MVNDDESNIRHSTFSRSSEGGRTSEVLLLAPLGVLFHFSKMLLCHTTVYYTPRAASAVSPDSVKGQNQEKQGLPKKKIKSEI